MFGHLSLLLSKLTVHCTLTEEEDRMVGLCRWMSTSPSSLWICRWSTPWLVGGISVCIYTEETHDLALSHWKKAKSKIKKKVSSHLVFSQHQWWDWDRSAHRHWLPALRRGRLHWPSSSLVQMSRFSHALRGSASCSLMHDWGQKSEEMKVLIRLCSVYCTIRSLPMILLLFK